MWQSYLGHTSAKFCGRWCCTQHCSRHDLPHKRQSMHICHVQQQHNFITYMPYRPSIAHALHSFCIQDGPYLPFTVATALYYSLYYTHYHCKKNKLHSYKITPEWLLQFHVSLNCMVSTMKIIHRCTTSIMHAPHNSIKLH